MSELNETEFLIELLSDAGLNPMTMTREEMLDTSFTLASRVVIEQGKEILGMRVFCVVCIIIAIWGVMS